MKAGSPEEENTALGSVKSCRVFLEVSFNISAYKRWDFSLLQLWGQEKPLNIPTSPTLSNTGTLQAERLKLRKKQPTYLRDIAVVFETKLEYISIPN